MKARQTGRAVARSTALVITGMIIDPGDDRHLR
jgi:hypothetical protein